MRKKKVVINEGWDRIDNPDELTQDGDVVAWIKADVNYITKELIVQNIRGTGQFSMFMAIAVSKAIRARADIPFVGCELRRLRRLIARDNPPYRRYRMAIFRSNKPKRIPVSDWYAMPLPLP